VTPIPGLGDGTGARAAHDVNVTTYAFKGSTLVSVTVFEPAADAATHGKALVEAVLAAS
jgi:hypothetical protein